MKYRIQRSLLFQLYTRLFLGILIFTSLILVLQILRLSEFLILYHVDFKDLAILIISMGLSFQPLVIPTAMVFASFSVFGHFVERKEWLSSLTSGIGYRHLLPPVVFFFALPVALACLYISLEAVPWCSRQVELTRERITNKKGLASIKGGAFLALADDVLILVQDMDPSTQELKHIFLYDNREFDYPIAIAAQKGFLSKDFTQQKITLNLSQGGLQSYLPKDDVFRYMDFEKLKVEIRLKDPLTVIGAAPASLRYNDLKKTAQRFRAENNLKAYYEFALDLHRRYALPLSAFIFVILAFAVSISSQKRYIRLSPMVQSLLVLIVMWSLYISGSAMVFNGIIPPWSALWIPNGLFIGVTIQQLATKKIMA